MKIIPYIIIFGCCYLLGASIQKALRGPDHLKIEYTDYIDTSKTMGVYDWKKGKYIYEENYKDTIKGIYKPEYNYKLDSLENAMQEAIDNVEFHTY